MNNLKFSEKILNKENYANFYGDIALMFEKFNDFYFNSDFKFDLERKNLGIDFLSLAKKDFEDVGDKEIFGKFIYENSIPISYIYGFVYDGYPYLQESKIGYVDGVFVANEHRGKGIGKDLIKSFISFCKKNKADIVKLNVKSENIKAKKLYEEIGFKLFDYTMTMKLE